MKLKGKTCLVTGAAQGIGKATAEMMIKEGARVIATDINVSLLSEIKGAEPHFLDVTNFESISEFAKKIGYVDILFNCAGFVHSGTILEVSDSDWDFSFTLNVKSIYKMIQSFLPSMIEKRKGVILSMSSICSSIKGVPNRFIYSSTKAAVIGITKSIAADYTTQGIRCNAICPATVDTPSLHERLKATGDYEQAKKEFIARQPMGRLASAKEIAAFVTYLASDDAEFITGQAYIIDGGWAT